MPGDAALIAVLIMDRPLCLQCLSTRTQLPLSEVEHYLERIGARLQIDRQEHAHCRGCGDETTVFAVHRLSD
jgi:hypothetical protein